MTLLDMTYWNDYDKREEYNLCLSTVKEFLLPFGTGNKVYIELSIAFIVIVQQN